MFIQRCLYAVPLLLVAGLGACATDDPIESHEPVEVLASELVACPSCYDGRTVILRESIAPQTVVNAGPRCGEGRACNNAYSTYAIGDVPLEPGSYEAPVPAYGYIPQFDEGTWRAPFELGCHGNDAQLRCAPWIPRAITEVTGEFDATTGAVQVLDVLYDTSIDRDEVMILTDHVIELLPPTLYDRVPAGCEVERCNDLVDPSGITPEE